MNNKMAKIHIYQQLNLKNTLSEQEEQRQNHRYREHFDGYKMGGGVRGNGGRSEGIKKYSR